jgi:predicted TPR repeat methyltransferase
VRALFDGYAADFDDHVVGTLRYRAHLAVADAARDGAPYAQALDLGCGTGLSGTALRPLAQRLAGVDLSTTMVERARARGVYDVVVQAELLPHLRALPAGALDLVAAADVFIYVGDLDPVFAAVAHALRPGGRFVFSVETAEGPGVELRPSLRYAHGTPGVLAQAALHGFALVSQTALELREEQRRPVDGSVFAFSRR